MTVRVIHGDCLEVMRELAAEGVQVDSVVTDPPYHLTSIVRRFGSADAAPAKVGRTGAYARASRGFMGKTWDGGDIAFRPEVWGLALSLLKPGGHLVAFGGTRTYHCLAVAIEQAGFEIRDQLAWLYGSGFPKSHNIGNGIDRLLGCPPRGRAIPVASTHLPSGKYATEKLTGNPVPAYVARTEAAKPWEGWGSALKPAWEPICLARKPLEGTLAANTLKHGVGGLNIDGCRVRVDGTAHGRWPANLLHDGSPEVLAGFPETGAGQFPETRGMGGIGCTGHKGGTWEPRATDSGSAARFFYTAKADASDRLGSRHPTVKPVDLMAWLCRLVTPPGGLVLDPFAGSGTTGMAAMREGFRAILIEREAEYVADIHRRLAHVRGEDSPLFGAAL